MVAASEGVRGGYRLAPGGRDRFLEIIDAIEGHKPLFDCRGARRVRCSTFPPMGGFRQMQRSMR
ncbi:hypothetical protein M8494_02760 [Serratia ureilytica]